MEWIKITDRLPEEGKRVLIHTKREHENSPTEIIGYTRIYGQDDEHLMWHSWDAHEDEDLFVTHWMPLPEPPKE